MPMGSADEAGVGASELAKPEESASPSGQKRPRDYGAELKGLTPDPESEGEVQVSSSAKRFKAAHVEQSEEPGAADVGATRKSAPESDVVPNTTAPAVVEVEASTAASSNEVQDKCVPAEQSATVIEKAAPQSSSSWNHGVTLGVRTSFGSSKLKFGAKSQDKVAKPAPSRGEHPISSDKDTDDGHGDKQASDRAEDEEHSSATRDTEALHKAEDVEDKLSHNTSFKFSDLIWIVPCGKLSHKRIEARKVMGSQRYWMKYFNFDNGLEKLIAALLEENYSHKDKVSRPVIEAALDAVIGDGQGLIKTTKKPKLKRSVFKRAAKEVLQAIEPEKFDEIFAHAESLVVHDMEAAKYSESRTVGQIGSTGTSLGNLPKHDPDTVPDASQSRLQAERPAEAEGIRPSGSANEGIAKPEEAKAVEPLDEEELRYQMLYFPGSEVPHCIYCAETTHRSSDCPQLTCEFCGSKAHSRFGCPTKRRCSKCHQFGHTEESCEEKLALARSELEPCAFCGADHAEEECTTIWRSFHPSESEIRKVKRIPDFCFTCGAMGHYGPECGLYRGESLGPDTTWCRANYTKYVDINSPDIALAWTDLDLDKINNQSTFHIRGKAHRQTHIHFVESDDSEEDFIRAPLKKTRAPPRGEIRIASNLSRGPQNGNGARDRPPRMSRRQQREREFSPAPPPPQEVLQRPPYYEGNGYQAYPTWQPPLPTGPPPPLPRTASYSYHSVPPPPPPPGPLPPRPDAYPYPQRGSRQSSSSAPSGGGKARRGQRKKRQ